MRSVGLLLLLAAGFSQDLRSSLTPFAGLDLGFMRVKALGVTVESIGFLGVTAGANYALFQRDDLAGGIGLQLTANLLPLKSSGSSERLFQIPIYAYIRKGAGSTPSSPEGFGFGAGLGGRYTSYYVNLGPDLGSGSLSYFNPSAFIDLSYKPGPINPITLRFYFDLFGKSIGGDILDEFVKYSTFGFSLVYNFSL